MANKMRLYQHSAHCPAALRAFLDCNPFYWCFIPQLWDDVLARNNVHFPNAANDEPAMAFSIAKSRVDNQRVSRCLNNVPSPPGAYIFSFRQRQQQRKFFEWFLSLPVDELPYSPLDLYQVAMITVCM